MKDLTSPPKPPRADPSPPTHHDGGLGIEADASDPLDDAVSSVRLHTHARTHTQTVSLSQNPADAE